MINEINRLKNALSVKEKQRIILDNADSSEFINLLFYIVNPLISYRLSEKTLRLTKNDMEFIKHNRNASCFNSIFDCCSYLSGLRGIDDATIRLVKLFLYTRCTEEERELYIALLSKSLRLGVTAKTINKVIPGLIPEWEVQQSYSIEKYPLKHNEEIWITEKLNGVRATFYQGRLIARSGQEISGMSHILDELNEVENSFGICSANHPFVFDGELTLIDKSGLSDNEAFRTATGILNSESEHKTGICYTIFDVIPTKEFESGKFSLKYSERRHLLNDIAKTLEKSRYISVLPLLYHGTEHQKIESLLDKMVAEDKEGLIINLDVPYRRTRHRGILKVKRFYTMDLPIIRCEQGQGRLSNTLGAFVLDYKGNEVNVGSGFTDEQRGKYWEIREQLAGAICEVKYKEISNDKNTGLESLQFPVFVQVRTDKDEISFD